VALPATKRTQELRSLEEDPVSLHEHNECGKVGSLLTDRPWQEGKYERTGRFP
jgi:hypothetical protein